MTGAKMSRAVFGVTLAALSSLLSGHVFAHHGWSWYGEEDFSLSGRVVATHFGNPHDRLTVEADGREWNLVLSPPNRSRRAGFDESEVAVGDTVTAFGRRHRDAATFEMKTERLKVGDNTYDLYPDRL